MLELKNITFEVDSEEGKKKILDRLSLEIPKGKFIAVTGPNGSGKSTLAKVIAGIFPVSSGEIYLNGENITDSNVTARAKKGISFAFQQPVRFQGIRVLDLLRMAAGNDSLSIGDACLYLSEVGLCARDYVNREIDASLSGGELKRIEIASVLARNTELTIFDEPEAGIDLWSFQNLIRVFQKMRKEKEGTILVISHQERILNIADEIIVVDGGKIRERGGKEEILPKLLQSGDASVSCGKYE